MFKNAGDARERDKKVREIIKFENKFTNIPPRSLNISRFF